MARGDLVAGGIEQAGDAEAAIRGMNERLVHVAIARPELHPQSGHVGRRPEPEPLIADEAPAVKGADTDIAALECRAQLRLVQLERRIEAHIFVAFLAYCLHVQLRTRLRVLAPGLTPRSMLEKFAAIQMLDVHFPTTDGRQLVFARYTQPEKDHKMLLNQLGWQLPPQSPPRITQKGELLQH